MHENNIEFIQCFSEETKNILLQIDNYGILNPALSKQLNCIIENYNLIVFSINAGQNIHDIRTYIDIIKRIKPDFTIFHTNISFESFEIIQNIIKYGCLSQLDVIIKSHYNIIDDKTNKYIVYCNETINENSGLLDIESDLLEEKLTCNVFSKISYPEGIVKL